MSLNFSFVYRVTVEKYRREPLYDQQEIHYETDTEDILILADDLQDAIDKAHDYAQELISESSWDFYDVIDALRLTDVFTGVQQDREDLEEVEEVYSTSQPDGYSED